MKVRLILVAACVLVTPAAADRKYGKQVRYAGVHPVAKNHGGGMCHIEAPHVHVYQPNKLEYRVHEDNHVFVGDPVAYGWDGPRHAYKGHHPIQVNVVAGMGDPYTHYCYLDGAHYHAWEPPEPGFQVVGGAYFYVGEPPAAYVEARPAYIGINATYRPLVYARPVVTVAPPVGWIGARVDVGPGVVVAPRGRVVAPGVHVGAEVHVPAPTIGIGVHIGGPAVIVREPHYHHGKFKHKKWKHKKWKH